LDELEEQACGLVGIKKHLLQCVLNLATKERKMLEFNIVDCNMIEISHEWFTEWAFTNPTQTFVLDLIVSHNCAEPITTRINITDLPAPAPYVYELTAEEGPYLITLKRTDDDGTIQKQTRCLFNSCNIVCELSEELSKSCSSKHYLLTYLQSINDCDSCQCKYACDAYNELKQTADDCDC
jgi:hypothetical protein